MWDKGCVKVDIECLCNRSALMEKHGFGTGKEMHSNIKCL